MNVNRFRTKIQVGDIMSATIAALEEQYGADTGFTVYAPDYKMNVVVNTPGQSSLELVVQLFQAAEDAKDKVWGVDCRWVL